MTILSRRNGRYHDGNERTPVRNLPQRDDSERVRSRSQHHKWRIFRWFVLFTIAITLGCKWVRLAPLGRQPAFLDRENVAELPSFGQIHANFPAVAPGVISDHPSIREGEVDSQSTSLTTGNTMNGLLKQGQNQSTRGFPDPSLFELAINEKKDPKRTMQHKDCLRFCYPDVELVEMSLVHIVAAVGSGASKQEVTPRRERAAICTIAKDEEYYIQEWLQYHLALGFDDIYVFDDSRSMGKTPFFQSNERVHILPISADLATGRRCGKQQIISRGNCNPAPGPFAWGVG